MLQTLVITLLVLAIRQDDVLPGEEETGRWGLPEDRGVAVLDSYTIDGFLKAHDFVFVKFYVKWCMHCKLFYTKYADFAELVLKDKLDIPVASYDMTDDDSVAKKFRIVGFPTLALFYKGYPIYYQGERTAGELMNWLKKTIQLDKAIKLETQEQIHSVLNKHLAVVLTLPEEGQAMLKNYQAVALNNDKVEFYYAYDWSVAAQLGVQGTYGVVVIRDFDEGNKILALDEVAPCQ